MLNVTPRPVVRAPARPWATPGSLLALAFAVSALLLGPSAAAAAPASPDLCLNAKTALDQHAAPTWPAAEAAIRDYGAVASKYLVIAGSWDAIAQERNHIADLYAQDRAAPANEAESSRTARERMRDAARGRIQGLLDRIAQLLDEVHPLADSGWASQVSYDAAVEWGYELSAEVIAADITHRGGFAQCAAWAFSKLQTAVDGFLDREASTTRRLDAAISRRNGAHGVMLAAKDAADAVVH